MPCHSIPPAPRTAKAAHPARILISTLAIATLALIAGHLATAGPLDPPSGPILPSYKTLTEVEPRIAINDVNTPGDNDANPSLFTITHPGSYYLTGNIVGVAGKNGIEIAVGSASIGGRGVTIDLMGFTLTGVPGSLDGVTITLANQPAVTIRNGTVTAWGGDGIDLAGLTPDSCILTDLRAYQNAGIGIAAGSSMVVTRCTAARNILGGISSGSGGTISECTSLDNGGFGFALGSSVTVSNCTSQDNTGDGLGVSISSTISGCAALGNGNNGFVLGLGSTITASSARLNSADGIAAVGGCMVTACSSSGNTGNGISISNGATVSGCNVRTNTLDGILAANACLIVSNTCISNGSGAGSGAGIHLTSSDNRVEGNNCLSADRGIDVDTSGNIIFRNTCSGNTTNWDLVAGNICLVVQGIPAGAISGSTGGTAPGSTDPNANFSY